MSNNEEVLCYCKYKRLQHNRATASEKGVIHMRQYTVADWVAEFLRNPAALSQVRLVERRLTAGLPLATWEWNCLEAHQSLVRAA